MTKSILKHDLEAFQDEELDHSSFGGSVDLSGQTSSCPHSSSADETTKRILGQRESRAVVGFRMLVFGALFLSMVLVAVMTYVYTSGAEQDEFQKSFDQDARKVLESLGASLDKAIAGVDAYVISLLSYARDTNQTWPFVTVPDFEARSGKFLDLTKAAVFMQFLLVTPEARAEWESYTAKEGREWSSKSVDYLRQNNLFQDVYKARNITDESIQYIDMVHDYSAWGVDDPKGLPETHAGAMLPMWQSAPLIPTTPVYNWDLATVAENESVLHCIEKHEVAISRAYMAGDGGDPAVAIENEAWADYFSNYISSNEEAMEPLSDFYYPMVLDMLDWRDLSTRPDYDPSQHKVAGILSQSVYWRDMIKGILPDGSEGVVAVFESPCSMSFTYEINGPHVKYLGGGDHHNSKYDAFQMASLLQDLDEYNAGANKYSYIPLERDLCPWTVKVFPSEQYEGNFVSHLPIVFTAAAVIIFLFTGAVFLFYDWWVERRQNVVMDSAMRSNAIISSLFPSNVRDRLYKQKEEEDGRNEKDHAFVNQQQAMTNSSENNKDTSTSMPIADLFPEATVMFADMVGFTAWSSSREPTQVFILLENIYGAFDRVCKRRGVTKIETIGDCYVAVCGLPEPRKNHAVVLCRFAADIRERMTTITKDLEHQLGPGTGDLQIRIGLHSGSVTAGVLRMDKSRFQLFGDTVNTAARMESNGKPNRIQVSQKTAEKVKEAGKGSWLTERPDAIQAKGKGTMKTFWVEPVVGSQRSSGASVLSDNSEIESKIGRRSLTPVSQTPTSAVSDRLIEWNVKIFEDLIKKVSAHRRTLGEPEHGSQVVAWQQSQSITVRHEVVDAVALLPFRKVTSMVAAETLELEHQVVQQLRNFIAEIASTYRPNSFHNFEHASHVCMSTNKLLHQITNHGNTLSQQEVFIHSFGVAMDPLAHLAIVFSALIHDVDHRGVPNPVLAKEEPSMAQKYEKSIAEQNSVDIAWGILGQDCYRDLWACLFPNEVELARFRQLVVNAVIATDVFDPELKSMRNDRWQRAFSASADREDPDFLNRKATIVLEHVIQASDIVHTVQHWTIYQKWNHRLFEEMYGAFLSGRIDKDPSEGWYNGELWFFDNYVIPLAKKLKECQVFGASGHEYLEKGYENRIEWEQKGEHIVQQMKEKMDAKLNGSSYTSPEEDSWWSSNNSASDPKHDRIAYTEDQPEAGAFFRGNLDDVSHVVEC